MATKSAIENRYTRVAKGFTKQEERRTQQGRRRATNSDKDLTILHLQVRGTTDVLRGGYYMIRKKVTVKHPTDYGFYKEAFVLNDMGKAKLKRLRRAKQFAADCV